MPHGVYYPPPVEPAATAVPAKSTKKEGNKLEPALPISDVKVVVTTSTSPTRSSSSIPTHVKKMSLLKSLMYLVPVYFILPYFLAKLHYDLPTPVTSGYLSDGTPVVSETLILSHIKALEDIGYRIVGTEEAILGEDYVLNEVNKLQKMCDDFGGIVKCEVWDQIGDGVHHFDIMDHPVLKSYSGVRNIIFRIANPSDLFTLDEHGKQQEMKNAVLLNAHIDSALPSKGAADDAIGVGVMLDVARVLIERKEPIHGSAIFLFNGAEETLQDASHLYSTQHPTAKTVKTVINLEAAGTKGPALLFQATSKEMIEAYGASPRPHGTVIAADIFDSGIIMSDTDFVQFQKYLGVTGMDMATVGHSYFYHTRKDLLENIEPGSAQHFGDNIIAELDYLLAAGSPLVTDTPWSPPNMAYFSLYDRAWFYYSMPAADKGYIFITAYGFVLWFFTADRARWKTYVFACVTGLAGLVANLLGGVLIALLMEIGLKHNQSWFTHEHICILLFGPAALTSTLIWQYFSSSWLPTISTDVMEQASLFGQMALFTTIMGLMQIFRIRSAYLFATWTGSLLLSTTIGAIFKKVRGDKSNRLDFVGSHILSGCFAMFLGYEAVTNVLDIFVPLTGRMGKEAPTEIIIGVISAFITALCTPNLIPLFHRFDRRTQRKVILGLLLISSTSIAIFTAKSAYDAEHPKRLGVQFVHNVTSGEQSMHLAQMDRGPGFQNILSKIHDRFGLPHEPLTPNPRHEDNADWDVLYPISAFLETEMFELGKAQDVVGYEYPEIKVALIGDKWDESSGRRKMTMKIEHFGIIYPVLAFSGDVESWSFNQPPPIGRKRHYIKAACSTPGKEIFEVEVTLAGLNPGDSVLFNWVGVDQRQLFPSTSSRLGKGLPSTAIFEDMHGWMEKEWNGSLDVLMIGVIAGSISL